ncbi:hypothetical protein [Candidatus Uabimicrobium sp. HlEnr_7]|uniref:hypothetical protein n=1 Tax=Candidatus Uabimicrobium helgolandensis TaxID=3095367 RepID=UPI003555F27A
MNKVLGILLGLIVVTCLGVYIRINILHNAVDIKIQYLQKSGMITNLSVLHNTYYAPIEQNFASSFEKAIQAYQGVEKIDSHDEILYHIDWDKKHSKLKIETFCQRYKEVYKILNTIPINNRCRFGIDFNQGYLLQQDHLVDLSTLSRLLLSRLYVAVESQDISLAIECLRSSVAILNSIREEPSILSLVHLRKININIVHGFQILVENRKLTNEHIQVLQNVFSQIPHMNIKRYFFSEMACAIDIFRNSKKHGIKEQFLDKIKATASKTIIGHLKKWQEDYKILNSKISIEDKIKKMSLSSNVALQGITLEQMYPLIFSFNETTILLKISLAIEAYYSNNDELPQSLQDLIPIYLSSIPTLLKTKKPFVYKLGTQKTSRFYEILRAEILFATDLKKSNILINKPK